MCVAFDRDDDTDSDRIRDHVGGARASVQRTGNAHRVYQAIALGDRQRYRLLLRHLVEHGAMCEIRT